jgi:hypothetical protein
MRGESSLLFFKAYGIKRDAPGFYPNIIGDDSIRHSEFHHDTQPKYTDDVFVYSDVFPGRGVGGIVLPLMLSLLVQATSFRTALALFPLIGVVGFMLALFHKEQLAIV